MGGRAEARSAVQDCDGHWFHRACVLQMLSRSEKRFVKCPNCTKS